MVNRPFRPVFVDPDDPKEPFFWPAVVIPQALVPAFQRLVSSKVTVPYHQMLVVYFEDASFSVVNKSECSTYDMAKQPFCSYIENQSFRNNNAVKLSIHYYETGQLPDSFSWLSRLTKQISPVSDVNSDSDQEHSCASATPKQGMAQKKRW